jgi:putative ABC transport system permease protein
MFNQEMITMAWRALIANKFRTLCSMLGIIIGVSTVIAVVSIGTGAKQKIEEQYRNLSVTSFIVFPSRGNSNSKLSLEDLSYVLNDSEYIGQGNASISGNTNVANGKENQSTTLLGVTDNFFDITNLDIEYGIGFSPEDIKDRTRKVMLGSNLATELFETAEASLGQMIKVSNRQFKVIGVLEENGASTWGTSYDDTIYAPFSTAEKNILGTKGRIRLVFLAKEVRQMEQAEAEITKLLRSAHKLRDSQEDDFRVIDPGSIVASATESSDTLSFLLVSVASIVLIVSGIGIMNVMFVTVAERTKEIGILKAIGAKQKDILTQFLLESVILSVSGGIIGIILGLGIVPLLKEYGAIMNYNGIFLGFGFSVLVGIIFGFYPALKASKLDPVDALRSE